MKFVLAAYAAVVATCFLASASGRPTQDAATKENMRKTMDPGLVGPWIWDDIKAGLKTAQQTRKPMMVVFR